jgi:hypothetical protein
MPREPIIDDLAPPQVDIKLILGSAAAVLLTLCIVIGATYWFYRWQVPELGAIVPSEFPKPQLMHDESATLKQVQNEARQRLTNWKWVDREAGVISVPIDAAIRALLARPDPYAPLMQPTAGASPGAGQ